jgi:uncharacterized protein YjbJ (UPF0337 family)
MNWDQVQTKWKQVREQARQHWSQINEQDLEHISGSRDRLVTCLQERYGMPREEAQLQADNWVRDLRIAEPGRTGRAGAV